MNAEQTIFTLTEAAAYLQISPAALMQWVVLGKLAGAVLNETMRFHREHLDRFIKDLAEKHGDAMKPSPLRPTLADESANSSGLRANPIVRARPARAERRSRRNPLRTCRISRRRYLS